MLARQSERAEGRPVIALPAGNEARLRGLPDSNEVLPRDLQRRLNDLRSATDDVGVRKPLGRALEQTLSQLLRGLAGEERRVHAVEASALVAHRGHHSRMATARAREGRPAAGIRLASADAIGQPQALAEDCDWQLGPERAVQQTRGAG